MSATPIPCLVYYAIRVAFSGPAKFFHLSRWERSDRLGDAKHHRSDPGEGVQPIDRPYPLTPQPFSQRERERTAVVARAVGRQLLISADQVFSISLTTAS